MAWRRQSLAQHVHRRGTGEREPVEPPGGELLQRRRERRGSSFLVPPPLRPPPPPSPPLTAALKELAAGRFDWLTLTSAATVDVLRERLASPADVGAKVAVIGEGTAAAFRRWARRDPDL
ncbi:MAG: uroporphyrinogen-III synthase [Actinomycetota bacterium]